jgi:hypothetical protein
MDDDRVEARVVDRELLASTRLEGQVVDAGGARSSRGANGSTPTTSPTPGLRASFRETAPVPQPISRTRAASGSASLDM